jgi:hypothetical protein
MRRIAVWCLALLPWLGIACGNGDDNGSPVPMIPADATTDSMADAVAKDSPAGDATGNDASTADAPESDADAAVKPDAETPDGAMESSMTEADGADASGE